MTAGRDIFGTRRDRAASDWTGRSGRNYRLVAEKLDSFVMSEANLYLIAAHDRVLWVGSAADLVSDPSCRNRFRQAMAAARQVFRLEAPQDPAAAIWDLEGAAPAAVTTAQAA